MASDIRGGLIALRDKFRRVAVACVSIADANPESPFAVVARRDARIKNEDADALDALLAAHPAEPGDGIALNPNTAKDE